MLIVDPQNSILVGEQQLHDLEENKASTTGTPRKPFMEAKLCSLSSLPMINGFLNHQWLVHIARTISRMEQGGECQASHTFHCVTDSGGQR